MKMINVPSNLEIALGLKAIKVFIDNIDPNDIVALVRAARTVPFPPIDCPADCTCYQSKVWAALKAFKNVD